MSLVESFDAPLIPHEVRVELHELRERVGALQDRLSNLEYILAPYYAGITPLPVEPLFAAEQDLPTDKK